MFIVQGGSARYTALKVKKFNMPGSPVVAWRWVMGWSFAGVEAPPSIEVGGGDLCGQGSDPVWVEGGGVGGEWSPSGLGNGVLPSLEVEDEVSCDGAWRITGGHFFLLFFGRPFSGTKTSVCLDNCEWGAREWRISY